jgi:hypothetical protein
MSTSGWRARKVVIAAGIRVVAALAKVETRTCPARSPLGWLILHEQVTLATLAGPALIVASVAAVVGREHSGPADDRAWPWWRLRGRPRGRGTGATAR